MIASNIDNEFYWNKILQGRIQNCSSSSAIYLQEMNLIDNDISIIVNQALINKQCRELDLSSNRFTSNGIRQLFTAFDQNLMSLEIISVRNNRIEDEDIQHISNALQTYSVLTHLRLGHTGITDNAVQYLIELLTHPTRLILIELENNHFTSQGIISLAQAVSHSTLKYFYIGNNQHINDECTDSLCDMMRKSIHLFAISLENIDFSDKCKEKLRRVAKTKHRLTLYL